MFAENRGYIAATGLPDAPAAISSADSNISTCASFCMAAYAAEQAAIPLPIMAIFFFLFGEILGAEMLNNFLPISL